MFDGSVLINNSTHSLCFSPVCYDETWRRTRYYYAKSITLQPGETKIVNHHNGFVIVGLTDNGFSDILFDVTEDCMDNLKTKSNDYLRRIGASVSVDLLQEVITGNMFTQFFDWFGCIIAHKWHTSLLKVIFIDNDDNK